MRARAKKVAVAIKPYVPSSVAITVPAQATMAETVALHKAAPDLLALARDYRKVVEYYIRCDEKDGDDEGANLKRNTLLLIDMTIARAEGRS